MNEAASGRKTSPRRGAGFRYGVGCSAWRAARGIDMVILIWLGFLAFVLIMLALDLGVFNRQAHVIQTREAMRWTSLCILLALLFTLFVYFAYENEWLGIGSGRPPAVLADGEPASHGKQAAIEFFTGYVIEMSLSLDNIFVIALIFTYFGVHRIHQHRVLFWGILGALVMRGLMIAAGAALIQRFSWIIYVFAVLLLVTAVKMMFAGEEKVDPERNLLVRIARRLYPVATAMDGQSFFVRISGNRAMTPLFICLLIIESTDVLFAVDSIPAVFAITKDPFIVFTSNIFAILCLRSMYFALAGMISAFKYLKTSLVFLLAYIAVKMLLSHQFEIPAFVSLAIIAGILSIGIVASLLSKRNEVPEPPADPGPMI
jgi:tellurite resistance protein TerC